MQRFRGGLVLKAHRLRVSLNSRLESNKEEEEGTHHDERARENVIRLHSAVLEGLRFRVSSLGIQGSEFWVAGLGSRV